MARLLIVEDHPELASLMVAAAESRGHEATAVHTGEDALAHLRPDAFHAAVVDLLLPDMRGSAVLSALRDQGIPAVAVSGVFKGDRFAREAIEVHGARAFFEKPFELMHLLESVEDLCGLAHMQPPPPPEDDDVVVFEDAALLDLEDEPGYVADDDEPVFGHPGDEAPPVVQGLTLVEEVEDPLPGQALPVEEHELPRPPSLEVSWLDVDEAQAESLPPPVPDEALPDGAPAEPAYGRETPTTLRTVDLGSVDALVALHELTPLTAPPVEEEEEVALEALAPHESELPAAPPVEEEVVLEALGPSEEPPAPAPEEEAALEALGPSEEPTAPAAQATEEEVALEALGPSEPPATPEPHAAEEEAALEALGPSETTAPVPQASEEETALEALGPSEAPAAPTAQASEEEAALGALGPSETPPAPALADEPVPEAVETGAPSPAPSAGPSFGEPEPGLALPFGEREKVWTKTAEAATRRRPPPEWSLSGDLKVTSVPRLLNAYYEARHSGELKLRQGTLQKVIYFEAGRPVYAASNVPAERFLRLCVRRGLLPEEKAREVATLAREQGLRSSEALLRQGLLDAARREQLVTEQVKEIIRSTLAWTEGAYGFSLMRPPRTGLVKLSVFPGDLILEGPLRTEHLVALRQHMPRSRRLFPSAAPPYGLHELTLTGPQALLLAYADGSKTVEDLLALTDLSEREVLATLRGLELSGVLEERREEPGNRRRISFGL